MQGGRGQCRGVRGQCKKEIQRVSWNAGGLVRMQGVILPTLPSWNSSQGSRPCKILTSANIHMQYIGTTEKGHKGVRHKDIL